MKSSSFHSPFEITSPVTPVAIGVLIFGIGCIPLAEYSGDAALRFHFYNFMVLAVFFSVAALVLDARFPLAARAVILTGVTLLIYLAIFWLGASGLFGLLVIPVLLAALMLNAPGVLVVSALELAALLAYPFLFPHQFTRLEAAVAVISILSAASIMWVYFRRTSELWRWSTGYLAKAQQISQETRARGQELEKALQNLANANQLLVQANHRGDRLRALAEKAEQAKSMFAARVSHEFRTPLNMIIGLVELMVEAPQIYAIHMPPELEKDLEVVLRNCRHLSNMIDDVLELTRAETDSLPLHYGWVSLPEIAVESAEVVSPLVQKKGLRLEIDYPSGLPQVYGDRVRIRQVILNLVSNACRFTEQGGIHIGMEQVGGAIITSVADTGAGISAEDAERIFEPFSQGSDELPWRDKGGSGLGLTISKQFVQMHGGQMWLKSQPGAGSTFFFTLPVNAPDELPEQPHRWIQPEWIWREEAFKSAGVEQAHQFTRPRVLVIDQLGGCAGELERYNHQIELVSVAGPHNLKPRNSTEPAADLVWVNAADIPAFLSTARQVEQHLPGVPIIGSAVPPSAQPAEASSLAGYLVKPVTMEKLRAALFALPTQPRKILIVDDDPEVGFLFQRLLSVCLPGSRVDSATSGLAALAALAEDLPDLVILDVIMPGMDGWEVLKILRAGRRTRRLPVLFISAQDLDTDRPLSPFCAALSGAGFSIRQVLNCSLVVANLLAGDSSKPGLTHPQTLDV